jgi:hypothetical protein
MLIHKVDSGPRFDFIISLERSIGIEKFHRKRFNGVNQWNQERLGGG